MSRLPALRGFLLPIAIAALLGGCGGGQGAAPPAAAPAPGQATAADPAAAPLLAALQKQLDSHRRIIVLLADEDRFSAVLTQLTTTSADAYWERLVEARAVCPERHEPNLLALLALASWLSGRGAAHASCLDQLARRSPGHPVLGLLSRLHRDGVPPRFWDG